MAKKKSRYSQIIERIFEEHYTKNAREVIFEREEFIRIARKLGITLPKNLGDILYSFRYRANLPESIRSRAPEGKVWVIRSIGPARYKFELASPFSITPTKLLAETKIPDATPGIITKYALNDEQALLAKLRYNRLIDIFTDVTCYSLQNHLRTAISKVQVETDELYVGIDQRGAQYVFPVQAKGGTDKLGMIQIEQDFKMCAVKFPALICRPIAAQFIGNDLIALFALEENETGIAISAEKHYRLVPPEEMTLEDLESYRERPFTTF